MESPSSVRMQTNGSSVERTSSRRLHASCIILSCTMDVYHLYDLSISLVLIVRLDIRLHTLAMCCLWSMKAQRL